MGIAERLAIATPRAAEDGAAGNRWQLRPLQTLNGAAAVATQGHRLQAWQAAGSGVLGRDSEDLELTGIGHGERRSIGYCSYPLMQVMPGCVQHNAPVTFQRLASAGADRRAARPGVDYASALGFGL